MEFVESVKKFNEVAGNLEQTNSRKMALYTSLIIEELAEQIAAYQSSELDHLYSVLEEYKTKFRSGEYDSLGENANLDEFADAGIDIAVTGLGSTMVAGYDVVGLANEVAQSNLSKFVSDSGDYIVTKDQNGKITKGANFWRADPSKYRLQMY